MLSENSEIIPEKYRVISGSALKMTALITMLIDHTACIFLYQYDFVREDLFTVLNHGMSLYTLMRTIGRMAFPIYCFLIAEGFQYTRSRKKYALNMLAFAVISEIPWNLAFGNSIFYDRQNVFFTLFFGVFGLCLYEHFNEQKFIQAAAVSILFVIVHLFKCDYGTSGLCLIFVMHVLKKHKIIQILLGMKLLPHGLRCALAFFPIILYNGKRGFIHGKAAKYLFYFFYPVHIMILYLMRKYLI